jgi:hypothetical protein
MVHSRGMGMLMRTALIALVAALAAVEALAADGPYKPGGGDARLDAAAGAIQLGIPRRVTITTTEVVVEVPLVVRPVGIGGSIERVEFVDLAINGIPFDVEPYDASFDLPDKEAVELPMPLRLHLAYAKVAPGVLEETLYPSDTLRLTGKATVSGTFRKWIFSLKRSLEVPIDVSRPNPVAPYHPGRLLEKLPGWLRR